MIKKWWWKILGIALMCYVLFHGLTTQVPDVNIIEQSIRNLFYHVPMWMIMMLFLLISFVYSLIFLQKKNNDLAFKSYVFVEVAFLLGICGCITGAIWAKATWGQFWPKEDPKLKGVAVGMLIYAAYFVLRMALKDNEQKERISSVYNIFVFPIFVAFIYVMPKLNPGLHPGSGDTVAFTDYNKLAKDLRSVFYPALLGWGLLFGWIVQLRWRILKLNQYQLNKEN